MSGQVLESQTETAEAAMDTLAGDLLEEVFEHADKFLRADDSLNNWAIFKWLAEIERENGLVSEATIGTSGSRWLLARQLGDTLQSTVNQIMQFTAAERAVHDLTQTFMFATYVGLWNLNDGLLENGPLADAIKPAKMADVD